MSATKQQTHQSCHTAQAGSTLPPPSVFLHPLVAAFIIFRREGFAFDEIACLFVSLEDRKSALAAFLFNKGVVVVVVVSEDGSGSGNIVLAPNFEAECRLSQPGRSKQFLGVYYPAAKATGPPSLVVVVVV
jgi:hypothetical protein